MQKLDLSHILHLPDVSYKGKILSIQDKQRILDMLDILFPNN